MPTPVSDSQLYAGVAIGILGTLAIAFGIMSFLERWFVTRREFTPIVKSIEEKLTRIETAVDKAGM